MKKGKLIFAIALLLLTAILWIATMAYPFKARLFPLFALSAALILLIIQVVREISHYREKEPVKPGKAKDLHLKYLAITSWFVATLLLLWILGFMGTVVLLPFLYLRFHKERWLISITLPLG